jgi:hypothetical protein
MNTPRMTARQAMVETFAYYKYEVTKFEADLWARIIDEYGDEAVLAFLQAHLRTSQFAPKVSDAQRLLSPEGGNEEAAFLRLAQEVRRCGPYGNPRFEDPAIASAVTSLGGWAVVNEQLPDPMARFDYEAFQRRFSAAYQVARSEQVVSRPQRIELRGLHALSLTPVPIPAPVALPRQTVTASNGARAV